jgi:hypothetical protein
MDERCPPSNEPKLDDSDVCMAGVYTDSSFISWLKECAKVHPPSPKHRIASTCETAGYKRGASAIVGCHRFIRLPLFAKSLGFRAVTSGVAFASGCCPKYVKI